MQTFTPREYLKIDIANSFGYDKKTWQERLSWFDQNEARLREMVHQADEPALFYAGIKAWEDVLAGVPIGHMISLDATASGMQLLAALTCDRKASELCNVVNAALPGSNGEVRRSDAYTLIYEAMLAEINETAKITRDDTKDAIMTSLYCSTAMPKRIFGEGALLDTFYATMHRSAPGAWELKEAFLAMWNPDVYEHAWVLPDNFHVHVKVMSQVRETVNFLNQPFEVFYNENAPTAEGRSLGANVVHSIDGMIVRELTRRCDYDPVMIERLRGMFDIWGDDDPALHQSSHTEDDQMVLALWGRYQDCGYLSARILQHLNVDNLGQVDAGVIRELLDSLPEKPFKVVAIHDAFRVLPTYGNDIRRQYALQLSMIAKSNLLGCLISQIIGKPVHIGKLDPDLHIEILDSEYALS